MLLVTGSGFLQTVARLVSMGSFALADCSLRQHGVLLTHRHCYMRRDEQQRHGLVERESTKVALLSARRAEEARQ